MNFTATATMSTNNFSYVVPFNQVSVIIYASIITPLCVFGITGNVITIAIVLTSSNLKATWYQLISSLAVSDLMSAITGPLFLYSHTWGFETWNFPEFLCRITWSVDLWTSYVTTLHIVWFATLRLISLQWPFHFKIFAKKYGKKSIVVIWIIAAAAGFVPFVIMTTVHDRDRSLPDIYSHWAHCGIAQDKLSWFSWYTLIFYPIFFYVPFVLIFCLSLAIGLKVSLIRKKRNAKRREQERGNFREAELKKRRKENQLVLQLSLIVGSFLLGYFPTTAFHFFLNASSYTTDQSYWDLTWRFAVISFILLRLSECLNPVFYNLSSSDMRQETKAKFKTLMKKFPCGQSAQEDSNKDSRGTNETTV